MPTTLMATATTRAISSINHRRIQSTSIPSQPTTIGTADPRRERYQKEFIHMETLLAEMNAQSDSFASMLGSVGTIQSSSGGSSG